MRQRVSELGGKLKLENTNPGTLVQVEGIPSTSAQMGEDLRQLKY
jgi:glucose-6-phosphate-specific signal transduction histidine kinase